jgi:hypothetical protein
MKVKSLKNKEVALPGVIYVLKVGDEVDLPKDFAEAGIKAGDFKASETRGVT